MFGVEREGRVEHGSERGSCGMPTLTRRSVALFRSRPLIRTSGPAVGGPVLATTVRERITTGSRGKRSRGNDFVACPLLDEVRAPGPAARLTLASAGQSRRDVSVRRDDRGLSKSGRTKFTNDSAIHIALPPRN